MSTRRVASPAGAVPRELRARGQATRDRLLRAGADVFAERGFHAARVDDIVKVAATSHGTFYLYFANKEELFRALAELVAAELEALAGELPPLTADPQGLAALEEWIAEFASIYAHAGPIIRAWTEAEIVASDVGRLGTNVHAAFTRALMDRIRSTPTAGIDPVVAAIALVAMIERTNYYALTGQANVEGPAVATTLARVTHAAIFGASPSA